MANGGIPPILIDPCDRHKLAEHPPLDGRSDNPEQSGVTGLHCTHGAGVTGTSREAPECLARARRPA